MLGEGVCGFADNFDLAFDGGAEEEVVIVVVFGFAVDEGGDGVAGFDDVVEAGSVFDINVHRGSRGYGGFRDGGRGR